MKYTIWFLLLVMVLLNACAAQKQAAPVSTVPAVSPAPVEEQPTSQPSAAPTLAVPTLTQPLQIPVTAVTPTAETPEAVVRSSSGLNLRAGPGLNYRVLNVLFDGDKVRLEGRSQDGSWVVARMQNGDAGWVYGAYLQTAQDMSSLPIAEAAGGPLSVTGPQPTQAPVRLPGKYTLYMTIETNQASVALTDFPANSDVVIRLSAAGQQMSVASGKTDGTGSASFAFAMPLYWPDGSRVTQTALRLTAATVDGSVTRSAQISYNPGP